MTYAHVSLSLPLEGEVSIYFAITEMDDFLGNEEVLGAQTAGENARGGATKKCEISLTPLPIDK